MKVLTCKYRHTQQTNMNCFIFGQEIPPIDRRFAGGQSPSADIRQGQSALNSTSTSMAARDRIIKMNEAR
jgi:hypothetical protein